MTVECGECHRVLEESLSAKAEERRPCQRLDRARFLIAVFQSVHDGLDTALRALGTVAQVRDGLKQPLPVSGVRPLEIRKAAVGVVEPPGGVVDAIQEHVELPRPGEDAQFTQPRPRRA